MNRRGMVYTSFAVLSSSLLLLMLAMPVSNNMVNMDSGDATRIGEASFFMDSVLDDMDRSLSIATRRALSGSTNYVIETGEPLAEPRQNITSALVNGSISGRPLNSTGNASLNEWTDRVSEVAGRSGYSLETSLKDYSFNSSGIGVKSSYSVSAVLKDPSTRTSFNRTNTAETEVTAEGLEDTMLLLRSRGRYSTQYRRCSFDEPAEVVLTGSTYSSGYAYGDAAVNPVDLSSVSEPDDRVLVVDDVDSYDTSEVNDFAGVVSATSNSSSGYSTNYVFGTGTISSVNENQSLILDEEQVWRSGFEQMIGGCYVPSERGPDVIDRFENSMVSGSGEGIATFVDVPELPPELRYVDSAVGYVYFNESASYGDLHELKGVSDRNSWFRLDQYHVDYWNLDRLVK